MDQKGFDALLPTIPADEKQAFQRWYVEYQDTVSWDDFKAQGFKMIVEAKKDVESHILTVTGKPVQLQLAFMPKDIARTSPFHPMSKQEMKERPVFKDLVIENSWGRITFSGEKLGIYEESILLALLFLSKKHKNNIFETSYSELCRAMAVSRGPTQYESIRKGLIRLTKSTVCTELYKDASNKKVVDTMSGTMVAYARQQSEKNKIEIMINPYFLTMFATNMSTAIDIEKRAKLKGDLAKALYRFIQTHQAGNVPFGLMTLCHAVNLNTEQPLKEIRRQMKKALAELRKQGHIKRWGIYKGDVVKIER